MTHYPAKPSSYGNTDSDNDGIGAACDATIGGGDDIDGDGDLNGADNCPTEPNPGQEDEDSDGLGDACDPVDNDDLDDDETTVDEAAASEEDRDGDSESAKPA